jgi:predicted membrane GTPase involved in stress response
VTHGRQKNTFSHIGGLSRFFGLLEGLKQTRILDCNGGLIGKEDLMGDLNSRRGRIAGMDSRGATTVIRAQVPMSEMLTYEQHLTSATGGRGSYHMEYSHYDEVPQQQQARIIAAAKAERGQEVAEEV